MAEQTRKQSLTAELQNARSQLAGFVSVVREDLDVGARLKSNYSRNPAVWFGAATVLGLLLSRLLAPRRKVIVNSPAGWNHPVEKTGKLGVMLPALKFVLTIAQPAIVRFFRERIENRAAEQTSER